MTDPQSLHAGNEGDVWKHQVLTSLLKVCLSERVDGPTFSYFESHAGRGVYQLSSSKEWRRGIGHALDAIPLEERSFYLETEAEAARSGLYLGSWKLASQLFEDAAIDWRMRLCDTSPEVAWAAQKEVSRLSQIEFEGADGFEAALCAREDFIFIDPFKDWGRSEQVALSLSEKRRMFAIWYPIFRGDEPSKLVKATSLSGYEALWRPMHKNVSPVMRGCGLLLCRELAQLAVRLLPEFAIFAEALGWQFHLRVPNEIW